MSHQGCYSSHELLEKNMTTKSTKEQSLSTIHPQYTFDTFVVGESNRLAYEAAKAIAIIPPASSENLFLLIYGKTGLGKSHLLQAVANRAMASNKVCYITTEAFTTEYIKSLQNNQVLEFREKYRSCDFLLLDDIGYLDGKTLLTTEILFTLEQLIRNRASIVLTSNCHPKEIGGLNEKLLSISQQGLMAPILRPPPNERTDLIKQISSDFGIEFEPWLIESLSIYLDGDIRILKGVLTNMAFQKKLNLKSDTDQ